MPDTTVFVYDAASARILKLSPDLRRLREFGREGPGPGELSPLNFFRYRPPPKFLIAARDGEVAVYDGVTIHRFGRDGDFRGYAEEFAVGSIPFWRMIGISYCSRGLVFATDNRGREKRELETWLLAETGAERLLTTPLAPLPATGVSIRQARPQWAVRGNYIFLNDGHSPVVYRYSLMSAEIDTLRLPDPGQRRRRTDAVPPRLPSGEERPDARVTAEWQWENLIVDPDGHMWIAPRASREESEKLMYVLNPETGRVREVTVPAYPRAFGAPGVYYSGEITEMDGVQVIRAYRLTTN